MKVVTPSIQETAFSCPHCGAYTSQTWARLFADYLSGEVNTPFIPDDETLERIRTASQLPPDQVNRLDEHIQQIKRGSPFLERHDKGSYFTTEIHNTWISICFNCKDISIWVYDRLVFPPMKAGSLPNADLPAEIRKDVEEARGILDLSPRGAAALLRLAIQKLCAHLGERGKNIDEDIASLVRKGLNPLVQQSLDVVRVIGNEAVHPGVIDLRDDRASAERLFDLVNIVAEQMITHPKSVQEMYAKLPASKVDAIQRRDSGSKKDA
jgi:hypothetical protein